MPQKQIISAICAIAILGIMLLPMNAFASEGLQNQKAGENDNTSKTVQPFKAGWQLVKTQTTRGSPTAKSKGGKMKACVTKGNGTGAGDVQPVVYEVDQSNADDYITSGTLNNNGDCITFNTGKYLDGANGKAEIRLSVRYAVYPARTWKFYD